MIELAREINEGVGITERWLSKRPLLASIGFGALTALSVWFAGSMLESAGRSQIYAQDSYRYAAHSSDNPKLTKSFIDSAHLYEDGVNFDRFFAGIEFTSVLIEGSITLHFIRKISS